ncbi:hypothetical protein JD844_007941 [Phrynosoma platyrhinos]|uniref:Eukaryotic translation initiation factor 4E type 2 n=2 Tax=Sauria TaxID=32561 RepID=A0ABQ7T3H1_PHRPL|nr:hypothetical protein JD844_007941 [Phrynosoma platyrhinos]
MYYLHFFIVNIVIPVYFQTDYFLSFFVSLKDDDSGDHEQNEENSTQKDGEKEKNDRDKPQSSIKRKVCPCLFTRLEYLVEDCDREFIACSSRAKKILVNNSSSDPSDLYSIWLLVKENNANSSSVLILKAELVTQNKWVFQFHQQAVVPGPAEHPLQYNYTFWYSRRTPGRPTSSQSYEQNIKQIGTFASVEQFWRFYSHMVRPGDLTGHSDFHLFKEGIKPMWEDDANKNGGKWIIRLRKGLASRCWENLILAMLGEQFMVGEEICGAVVSVRFQEDIISIWNKTASDQATTARIRDTLRRVLNLPPNTIMEYKTHTDSIKDNSSFRNTKITL